MKHKWKAAMLITAMVATITVSPVTTQAAKIKLAPKKVTMTVGEKKVLTVKGTKKKVKWKSLNKKIASVNKKGVVKAKRPGKTVITAKVKGKTLKCKVTVKKAGKKPAMSPSTPSKPVSPTKPQTPSKPADNQGGANSSSGTAVSPITASTTQVKLAKAGDSTNVTITLGQAGSVSQHNDNVSVASAKFGSWNGLSIPLTITAKAEGTTYVTVSAGEASVKIKVEVGSGDAASTEQLTVTDTAPITFTKIGAQKVISATHIGSGSVSVASSNTSVVTASYGQWSGNTLPITITAKGNGDAKITISGAAKKFEIAVSVKDDSVVVVDPAVDPSITPVEPQPSTEKPQPSTEKPISLSVSKSTVTLANPGDMATVDIRYNGTGSLKTSVTNAKVATSKLGTWTAGVGAPITITAKDKGTTVVKVTAGDLSANIFVTVQNAVVKDYPLTISDNSPIKFTKKGMTKNLTIIYEGPGTVSCDVDNALVATTKLGKWNNGQLPLTITAVKSGQTKVKIASSDGKSITLSVTVDDPEDKTVVLEPSIEPTNPNPKPTDPKPSQPSTEEKVTLSATKTKVVLNNPGDTETIVVKYNGSGSINKSLKNAKVATSKFGDFDLKLGGLPLTITAKDKGTTDLVLTAGEEKLVITVEVKNAAVKDYNLIVSDTSPIVFSKANETKKITVTYDGEDPVECVFDTDAASAKFGEWNKHTTTLTITAGKPDKKDRHGQITISTQSGKKVTIGVTLLAQKQ